MAGLVTATVVLLASLARPTLCDEGSYVPEGIPPFPLQFSAKLEVTAHLVDRTKPYPPWLRRMELNYDHSSSKAKIIITEGFGAGKTYIRHYSDKREYMIREGEFPTCRRSYLGEAMPLPELPPMAVFQGMVKLDDEPNTLCQHWLHQSPTSRVHVFVDHVRQVPRRLVDEAVIQTSASNGGDADVRVDQVEVVPLTTYDLLEVKIGQQEQGVFELPQGYTTLDCDLHVGGFPYLHLFHDYLRV